MTKKNKLDIRGFSLVEITVVVAILIVLLAVLTPSLLRYTENSRMQKDESAMDELCNSIKLAMADSIIFDEVCSYAIPNNYITYTDSSGIYASKFTDEEFWAPDGSGHAVTITFNPDGDGVYTVAQGIVNDMTYGNGSVADSRTAEGLQQCYFNEMGDAKLYHKVEQTIGATFAEKSATYKNSSYTVFITFEVVEGIKRADIYGEWNGTNLTPTSPASLGSGTNSYDADDEPEQTKTGGTTQSNFTSSDLTGGGGTSGNPDDVPSYKRDNLPCGHKEGTEGDHAEKECGHYACRCTCAPAECGVPGHTVNDGKDHSQRACGHNACECSGCIIPEGGIYYVGHNYRYQNYQGSYNTSQAAEKYVAGDPFPAEVNSGDVYYYQGYEYRYNQKASTDWSTKNTNWSNNNSQGGWGVCVDDKTKTSYPDMLSVVNNVPVVNISNVYMGCNRMTNIPKLSEYATNATYAFGYCKALTSPQIDMSKLPIADCSSLFYACSSLKDASGIILPKTTTNMLYAFSSCSSLEVPPVIPENPINMASCFSYCQSLTTAPLIPGTVTNLHQTFQNCTALVNPPVVSYGITAIKSTFQGCTSLLSTPLLPNSVTTIESAFTGCTSLKTIQNFNPGLQSIKSAFSGCTALETVPPMPDTITDISSAFYGCTGLKTASVLSKSITSISKAFEGCTSLTTVGTIPSTATSLINVFKNCTSLTGEITFESTPGTRPAYASLFANVDFEGQQLSLVGESAHLDLFGSTGYNYCDTCNGCHKTTH